MCRSRSEPAQPLGLGGRDVERALGVARAHVALAHVGQLDGAAVLVEQPGGAGEGDELPRPPQRVLEPGREQLLDRELGDELVEPEALALVDGAQQAVRVAEAGGGDGTHARTVPAAPRRAVQSGLRGLGDLLGAVGGGLARGRCAVAPGLLREVVAPAPASSSSCAADVASRRRASPRRFAGDALAAEATDFRVEPEAAAFDAADLAAGFAAPAFGFEAAVDFGFDAAVDFGFDAAVAAACAPRGLRRPAWRARPLLADAARAVRVAPDVALPVFAPPRAARRASRRVRSATMRCRVVVTAQAAMRRRPRRPCGPARGRCPGCSWEKAACVEHAPRGRVLTRRGDGARPASVTGAPAARYPPGGRPSGGEGELSRRVAAGEGQRLGRREALRPRSRRRHRSSAHTRPSSVVDLEVELEVGLEQLPRPLPRDVDLREDLRRRPGGQIVGCREEAEHRGRSFQEGGARCTHFIGAAARSAHGVSHPKLLHPAPMDGGRTPRSSSPGCCSRSPRS